MSATLKFDQRAIAVVELLGTTTECDDFEQALRERRWPILQKEGGPSTALTARTTRYLLECRFPGSRVNARRGARERIEVVGDELQLDLNVEVTDLVVRDPEDRPVWFAYERPAADDPPVSPPTRRARWQRRVRRWCAERLAPYRTGRHISALSRSRAEELATRTLPGSVIPSPRVTVRRPMATPDPDPGAVIGRRRGEARDIVKLCHAAAALMITSSLIARLWPQGLAAWWVLGVMAVTALGLAAHWLTRILPGKPGAALGATLALGVVMAAVGTKIESSGGPGAPPGALGLVLVASGYVVFTGIRLLVRQWSWRVVAPWLLPAVLPLALGFFPSLGLGLHALYLDAFGLNLEDVEIPRLWQLIATVRLGLAVNLWLIALAGLGYMQHLHWCVRDRWVGYTLLGFFAVVLLLNGAWNFGLQTAARAGAGAVQAAASGKAVDAYFGIAPQWVCVRPIGPADDIHVDGGEFHPSRPYLKIGDASGTAVLWDPADKGALKMPMDKLRIIPVDEPSKSCALSS
ncbi:hypothetical protein GTY67_05950 [Streptomyces sp. SID8374]|uniref:hypothetical protein n=1 Tax=Streptomyces sp. SID8374 TaxID=2690354 RepID=UPI00136F1DDF|nr:hypothetical protein [Streptomyces sp. SID8374]MYX12968.1 hypothetical protein [Streptomyces sp. SID8374]